MASQPAFASTPRCEQALCNTANTNRDGTTGTYTTVFTGGTNGSRVDHIRIQASETTTAGVVRIWRNKNGLRLLLREIMVQAITPSTSIAAWSAEMFFSGANLLLLADANDDIDVSVHNAEDFNVFIDGGDF